MLQTPRRALREQEGAPTAPERPALDRTDPRQTVAHHRVPELPVPEQAMGPKHTATEEVSPAGVLSAATGAPLNSSTLASVLDSPVVEQAAGVAGSGMEGAPEASQRARGTPEESPAGMARDTPGQSPAGRAQGRRGEGAAQVSPGGRVVTRSARLRGASTGGREEEKQRQGPGRGHTLAVAAVQQVQKGGASATSKPAGSDKELPRGNTGLANNVAGGGAVSRTPDRRDKGAHESLSHIGSSAGRAQAT